VKREHRRMVEARRLYKFEELFSKELPKFALRDRSHGFLNGLLADVWAKHGRKNVSVPALAFGEGTPHGGTKVSFAEGYRKIELVKGQRTVQILLRSPSKTTRPVKKNSKDLVILPKEAVEALGAV